MFYETYSHYKDIGNAFDLVSSGDVEMALSAKDSGIDRFIALLSPAAETYLEEMAARSRGITLCYFGKTIQLYTPIYLSNYCENQCAYCGFNSKNTIERKRLSYEEVEEEARFNRLGTTALYFKIRLEFLDEEEHIERPVDRTSLHLEFADFMEENASLDLIPKTIKDEVVNYGSELMKKAVLARHKEALDAS